VEVKEDLDHFVRRQHLAEPIGKEKYDRFALALLDANGRANLVGDEIRVDGQAVPLDRDHWLRINFVGPPGSIPVVPFHRVLEAARGGPNTMVDRHEQPVDFRDAIAIVGATAGSLGDCGTRRPTPTARGTCPG
jgi:hypothetical protein